MRKKNKKTISILLTILTIISIGVNSYAHSGRTDSSGGHKDNNNKSGLGSYHYHCGGHPAHLHTNGVCPYSSSSSSSKSSASSSSSSTKTTSTVPTTIVVTDIKINENVTSMKEGESQKLTATITPNDATDKNITWKSSDESIATVSTTGEVVAKKYGTVDITATSSNGKTSTIKINIKELPKAENNAIIKTSTNSKNNITNNTTTDSREDSNPLEGVITIGLLGGGSYLGYTQYRKKNKKI
ncbi:MAG: Ig-like domain-containing protein [Clostridia bacterium]